MKRSPNPPNRHWAQAGGPILGHRATIVIDIVHDQFVAAALISHLLHAPPNLTWAFITIEVLLHVGSASRKQKKMRRGARDWAIWIASQVSSSLVLATGFAMHFGHLEESTALWVTTFALGILAVKVITKLCLLVLTFRRQG